MRIHAPTPAHLGEEEICRRQRRYDDLVGSTAQVVVLDQPPLPGIPRSFDTKADVAASDAYVLQRARELTLSPGDLVVPDCILDPVLEEIGAFYPVQGILRLTVGLLTGLGLRFGAVARNPAVGDALTVKIRSYDPTDRFVGTEILDLPTEAVTDDARWHAALVTHVQILATKGADVVINGCSAVAVDGHVFDIPVVDPTQLALRALSLADDLGILPLLTDNGDHVE